MLAQAVSWKLLDVNPARDVRGFKVQNARLRYLEPEELVRVLAAAQRDVAAPWLVPAIILAVHMGVRQGELLRLRWSDLSPTLHLATIPLTKNNEVKHVPLNAEVQAVLAALPRHGATVLAWPWGEPISRITLYHAFQRALAAAGITDFRWHDLRHTFASHLVMAGVDLHTTGELLGHRDPQSTRRYAHLSPAHKAAAVAKLTTALAPEPVRRAATQRSRPATATEVTRFKHAPRGRQTPAKRKYVESRRVGEWRRGESNPGRRGAAVNHGPRKPALTSLDYPGSTRQVLPFGHRVPKTSVLGHQRGAKRVPSERASTRARCRTFPRGTRPRRDRGSTPKDPQESNLTRKAERFPPTNLPSPTYEDGDLNPMAGPTRPGFLRGLRPQVSRDDRLTGP